MTTRKPKMCKHRRKILDLLEYVLEVDPSPDSVYNVFALYVAQVDEDLIWVDDETWALWFEEYAEKISKGQGASKNCNHFVTAEERDAAMCDANKGD